MGAENNKPIKIEQMNMPGGPPESGISVESLNKIFNPRSPVNSVLGPTYKEARAAFKQLFDDDQTRPLAELLTPLLKTNPDSLTPESIDRFEQNWDKWDTDPSTDPTIRESVENIYIDKYDDEGNGDLVEKRYQGKLRDLRTKLKQEQLGGQPPEKKTVPSEEAVDLTERLARREQIMREIYRQSGMSPEQIDEAMNAIFQLEENGAPINPIAYEPVPEEADDKVKRVRESNYNYDPYEYSSMPGMRKFIEKLKAFDAIKFNEEPERKMLAWRKILLDATDQAREAQGSGGLNQLFSKYDSQWYLAWQIIGDVVITKTENDKNAEAFRNDQLSTWNFLYASLGVETAGNWQAYSQATTYLYGRNWDIMYRQVTLDDKNREFDENNRPGKKHVSVADAVEIMDGIVEFNDDGVYVGDLPVVLEDGMRAVRAKYGTVGKLVDDGVGGQREEGVDLESDENINARYLAQAARNLIVVSGRPALWGHKNGPPYFWLEKIINFYRQMGETYGAFDFVKLNRFKMVPPTTLDYMSSILTKQSKRIENEFDGSTYNTMVAQVVGKLDRGETLSKDEERWRAYVPQFRKYGPLDRSLQMLDKDTLVQIGLQIHAKQKSGESLSKKEREYLKAGILRIDPNTDGDLLKLTDRPPMNYQEAVNVRMKAKQLKDKEWADDRLRIKIQDPDFPSDPTKKIIIGNPDRVWDVAAQANNEWKKAAQGTIDVPPGKHRAPLQDYIANPMKGLDIIAECFGSNALVSHLSGVARGKWVRYLVEWGIKSELPPDHEERERMEEEGHPYPPGSHTTVRWWEDKNHGGTDLHLARIQTPFDAVDSLLFANRYSGMLPHDDLEILKEKFVYPSLSNAKRQRLERAIAEGVLKGGSGAASVVLKSMLK